MPPSAELTKKQVLDALSVAREKVLSAAAALPPEKQDQVFLGIWDVKDLLAHLAGWDYANLEASQAVLAERLPAVGGTFLQMEDEIASMAAIIGASWGGMKALTATSGPGISLMLENIGFAVGTETPLRHHQRDAG